MAIGQTEVVGGEGIVSKGDLALLGGRFAGLHHGHTGVAGQRATRGGIHRIHSERHIVGLARQGELGAAHSDGNLTICLDECCECFKHAHAGARRDPVGGDGGADSGGGDVGR